MQFILAIAMSQCAGIGSPASLKSLVLGTRRHLLVHPAVGMPPWFRYLVSSFGRVGRSNGQKWAFHTQPLYGVDIITPVSNEMEVTQHLKTPISLN